MDHSSFLQHTAVLIRNQVSSTTCSRSRIPKCEGVIRRKLIPSVIDASTISNDMTSDEFPPLMGGELCISMSHNHPAPLISSPGIER